MSIAGEGARVNLDVGDEDHRPDDGRSDEHAGAEEGVETDISAGRCVTGGEGSNRGKHVRSTVAEGQEGDPGDIGRNIELVAEQDQSGREVYICCIAQQIEQPCQHGK